MIRHSSWTLLAATLACSSGAAAEPSPRPSAWQTTCSQELDRARVAAAAFDHGFAKLRVSVDDLGGEIVKVDLGNYSETIVAHRNRMRDRDAKPDAAWTTFEETLSTGEYHLLRHRDLPAGWATFVLATRSKAATQRLADTFQPALDRCLAAATAL